MEGSIHHDKHGHKVHYRGKWYRRGPLRDGKVVSWKHDYTLAEQFLIRLNWEGIEGSFDERNYAPNKPLAFTKVAEKWFEKKKKKVRHPRDIAYHLSFAYEFFRHKNICNIRYGQLQDFVDTLPDHLKDKTKANILETLHNFFRDIVDREQDNPNPITMPKFPKVPYICEMRKILNKEDQLRILQQVKEKDFARSPKIFYGILWLLTYGLRPGELKAVKMNDFDNGYMKIRSYKGRVIRTIKLLLEDWNLVKQDNAIGEAPFWRHPNGEPLGRDSWYNNWKRRAGELGFHDVDLYGSTRHSSATSLSDEYTPEEIRAYWTGHTTSKSFYRYMHVEEKKKQEMYAKARGNKIVNFLTTNSNVSENDK